MKPCLALAAFIAFLSASCGSGTAPETRKPEVAVTTESAGEPAPRIEGVTIEGEQLALSDLRGRPVFVNVWASW